MAMAEQLDTLRDHHPPHLTAVQLRNFRGFKRLPWTPLRPLTFLVGQNSSGKSTIADALLFLAQSDLGPTIPESPIAEWSGHLVDLGSYEDTVYQHSENLRISIGVRLGAFFGPWHRQGGVPDRSVMGVQMSLGTTKSRPQGRLQRLHLEDLKSGQVAEVRYNGRPRLSFRESEIVLRRPSKERPWDFAEVVKGSFDELLGNDPPEAGLGAAWGRIRRLATTYEAYLLLAEAQRVSSGRAAPKRWYALAELSRRAGSYPQQLLFDTVDPYMIQSIGQDGNYFISRDSEQNRADPQALSKVLRELEIADWIEEVELSTYHNKIDLRDAVSGVRANLMDVGYGTSQVIPVIAGCLSMSRGPLVVEQPEIHLHPKAQSIIAGLLAETSRRRQVIVETHSVHVINAARIKILEGALDYRDVVVLFVTRTPAGTEVVPIFMDSLAEFDKPWPSGFFDERYSDTMKLLSLKQRDA